MAQARPDYEEALRRLTLGDEEFVVGVVAGGVIGRAQGARLFGHVLDARTRRLATLAAVIAAGGSPTAIDAAVSAAFGAGASKEDVVDVLLSIALALGSARLVGCAPHVAAAIEYDMSADFEDLT
jgi:alkylhydroperoxidase/carboxymuconolactone decarboxylase family protein YurZ